MVDLSIIIPTYNRAYIISRAIQSVLNQTYRDFEVLVIDDGSTDNTSEIVKSFNDKRLRYIRHGENRGVAAARNTGIMSAEGKYIAFQDSDDEWFPEKLEKQMAVFTTTSPQIGVMYTGFLLIEGNTKTRIPSSKVTKKEGNIYNSLLRGNFVSPGASIVKRECFTKAGMFDEHYVPLEDWEFWLRISRHYHFKCVDEPLLITYHMPDSISSNQNAALRAHRLILEKYYEDIKKDKKTLAIYFSKIGDLLCFNGELNQGREYLLKAFTAFPLNVKPMMAVLASLLGQNGYDRAAISYQKIQDWWSSRTR